MPTVMQTMTEKSKSAFKCHIYSFGYLFFKMKWFFTCTLKNSLLEAAEHYKMLMFDSFCCFGLCWWGEVGQQYTVHQNQGKMTVSSIFF